MSDIQLFTKIRALPEDIKHQVADFVEFLASKSRSSNSKVERKFGYAKDFFEMSDDFDEPFDDFKSSQHFI